MPTPLLGDLIASALAKVGITTEKVEKALKRPCKCRERVEMLNGLDAWARRVVSGKVEKAAEYLSALLYEYNDIDEVKREGSNEQW